MAKMEYISRGQGSSDRALQAYSMGEKPFSKWTKSDILEGLKEIYSDMDLSNARALNLSNLKRVALYCSSWHHTGKYGNCTSFCAIREEMDDVNALILQALERQASEPKKEKKEREALKPSSVKYYKIYFTAWECSGRFGKKQPVEKSAYAVAAGRWFYCLDGSKKDSSARSFNGSRVVSLKEFKERENVNQTRVNAFIKGLQSRGLELKGVEG